MEGACGLGVALPEGVRELLEAMSAGCGARDRRRKTDVSITSPSAPSDVASRKSCRLGHNVYRLFLSVSIVSFGLFVGQGTDGEMQAGGKETVK